MTGPNHPRVAGFVADGAAEKSSATFARHFLQNLSPGLIIYPHERHNRIPGVAWETLRSPGSDDGKGGGGDGETGGTAALNGAGDFNSRIHHFCKTFAAEFITGVYHISTGPADRIPAGCEEEIHGPGIR